MIPLVTVELLMSKLYKKKDNKWSDEYTVSRDVINSFPKFSNLTAGLQYAS